MKFIITELITILTFLLLLTQVIIPSFIQSLDYFWLFKPNKNKETPKPTIIQSPPIEELKAEVSETIDKVKIVKEKVDKVVEDVNNLKSEAEKI